MIRVELKEYEEGSRVADVLQNAAKDLEWEVERIPTDMVFRPGSVQKVAKACKLKMETQLDEVRTRLKEMVPTLTVEIDDIQEEYDTQEVNLKAHINWEVKPINHTIIAKTISIFLIIFALIEVALFYLSKEIAILFPFVGILIFFGTYHVLFLGKPDSCFISDIEDPKYPQIAEKLEPLIEKTYKILESS